MYGTVNRKVQAISAPADRNFTENSRRVALLNPDFVYGDDCAYEVSVMKERF